VLDPDTPRVTLLPSSHKIGLSPLVNHTHSRYTFPARVFALDSPCSSHSPPFTILKLH
jgi:hypothetical protein